MMQVVANQCLDAEVLGPAGLLDDWITVPAAMRRSCSRCVSSPLSLSIEALPLTGKQICNNKCKNTLAHTHASCRHT